MSQNIYIYIAILESGIAKGGSAKSPSVVENFDKPPVGGAHATKLFAKFLGCLEVFFGQFSDFSEFRGIFRVYL